MVSKIATFRLPDNLIQEIRFRAEATGRDRTAVVIEALKQAFGFPQPESPSTTVEELQEQLNQLENKLTTLSQQLTQLTQKSISQSPRGQISPTNKQEMPVALAKRDVSVSQAGGDRVQAMPLAKSGEAQESAGHWRSPLALPQASRLEERWPLQSSVSVASPQELAEPLASAKALLYPSGTPTANEKPYGESISKAAIEDRATIASDKSSFITHSFVSGEAFRTQTNGRGKGKAGQNGGTKHELEGSSVEGKPDEAELQELAARIEQQARIFDQVLSASPDPICVIDRMGRFTYANLAIAQLFGLPQRNILGKTWQQLDLLPELMESEIDTHREMVFATKRPSTKEISYPTVNGVRYYESILSPILGLGGSVEAVICTARDITERKQVEESLRESEANYRHLFEYANDSIFIIDLSTSRILDANQNAARRLGYTRKELLKLKTKDIDAPIRENLHKTINHQLQASGSIIFEHVLRRKDGTEIQVEISSRIIEYRDQLVSLSFVRDITARMQADERMRLLESAVENTQDGILITEAQHIDAPGPELLYVNQAFTRITGYDLTEVLGRTPRLLQGPKTDRSQLDKIRTALSKQQAVQVELLNYRKDGSEFWVELNIVPITNKRGQLTHWVALQREITERKQAETALLESKQQISQILESITDGFYTLDHEWRFTYFNQKAEQILQTSRTEILGKSLWEVIPNVEGSLFESQFHKAVKQQVTVMFEAFHTPLKKWFEVHAYPCSEGLYVVFNDITKSKQIEG